MAEEKRITPITLTDDNNGNVYVLEFDRASVKFAEARGFNTGAFDNGVNMSAIEELFFYSFRMHQPKLTTADTDIFLYEKLCGMPEGMLERLLQLYMLPFDALVQDTETGDTPKNVTMTAKF